MDTVRSKNPLTIGARALGIEAGEGKPLALAFGQAFFFGVSVFTLYTAANSLFLSIFGVQAIPYVYITAAVVVTLSGYLFARLERRLAFPVLVYGTLAFFLLTLLALRLLLNAGPTASTASAGWQVFLLMVWFRLLWTVGNLVLWALAGRLFNVRQGKRLFNLIMAGAVLAIIISGFLTSPLLTLIGVADLLLIASGSLGVVWALAWLTVRLYGTRVRSARPLASGHGTSVARPRSRSLLALCQSRYVRLLLLYTLLSTLGTYVLDYAFFSEASIRYADAMTLARFFGRYMSVSTSILLGLSLASGPFFNRYGLRVGILANPSVVALGALSTVAVGFLFGRHETGLFWPVVLTKLSDDVLVVAMTNTAARLLLQPLPLEEQVPVQTLSESMIGPIATGIAGVLLLLTHLTSLQAMSCMLVILAGWLLAAVFLQREYLMALTHRLVKAHSRNLSPYEKKLPAPLETLPDVRAVVVRAFIDRDPEALPALHAVVDRGERDRDVLLALIRTCVQYRNDTALAFLYAYIEEPDVSVRRPIVAALSQCNYRATGKDETMIQALIRYEAAHATWTLASLADLEPLDAEPCTILLREALTHTWDQQRLSILSLLSFVYDAHVLMGVRDTFIAASDRQRAYALEALDILLPRSVKAHLLPLFHNTPKARRLRALGVIFPQAKLTPRQRLQEIWSAPAERLSAWPKACAWYVMRALPGDVIPSVSTSESEAIMLSILDRVRCLKNAAIFSRIAGDVLQPIAQAMQEVQLSPGERLLEQGEVEHAFYIIVAGEVEVLADGHAPKRWGPHSVHGDLAWLARRPCPSSCIAVTATTALCLQYEVFQDVVEGHPELALPLIQSLAQRLEQGQLSSNEDAIDAG